MFRRLRLLTAGESHGPKMSGILEGLPAGLPIDADDIQHQLARRQKGYGAGPRMKKEKDQVVISAGANQGHTTGGPLALEVINRDHINWAGKDIEPMTRPRPGHADLTGAIKYGHRDLRLSLERASARETVMRVAAGALCRGFLRALGIRVGGYVRQLGSVALPTEEVNSKDAYIQRFNCALKSDLSCPNPEISEAMRREVRAAMESRDTLGGIFEVVALGVPPGLGSYVQMDRRLDARLAMAMMSIPAMKGVEIGPAFDNATKRGTQVHDAIDAKGGRIGRASNRAGGLEGGISNGEPIVIRVAMKPISTTLTPQSTVDLTTGDPTETRYERSDFCALPRAVPIGEAMLSLVLTDALLEKLGGDNMDDIRRAYGALRQGLVADLPMNNVPWRFGYDG